jgi:hypothetical protein
VVEGRNRILDYRWMSKGADLVERRWTMKSPNNSNGANRRNGQKKLDLMKVGSCKLSPHDLKPSAENATLYRERNENDSDWKRFVESVRAAGGVQQEILISRDRFIISGHQRTRAAIEVELKLVPIRVLNLRRDKHTADDWLKLLREHNTGREKSCAERIRERLVDITPEDALMKVVHDKLVRARPRMETIEISDRPMKRYNISPAKAEFRRQIKLTLEALAQYLPVSLRAIHYRLVSKIFLRNLTLPDSLYRNDLKSYGDLSDMLTRMRIAGEVTWSWIEDETRPESLWSCWDSAADFIDEMKDELLSGYGRDLMQSQYVHFEIVAEKLTVKNFVDPVAGRYTIPVVVCRGNSGIQARNNIFSRYMSSGKDSLLLLCLGDCDPDGDSIVESTVRSMRDDFGCDDEVEAVRVAMTHQQADKLDLPKMLEAKEDSSNFEKFVQRHGRTDCYELEAVEPDVMQTWLDEAIRSVIDVEAYNEEVQSQAEDVKEIQARREAIMDLMKRI